MSTALDPGLVPHPRTRHDLVGHEGAERAFVEAIAAGRLPHAWLIGGREGIGKATLAYRVARHLLAKPDERDRRAGGLAIDPESRTARLVAAGAHPNLAVLDLATADGDVDRPPAKSVPVKTARRALAFFAATAADGGHRVCIVDTADDLTPQAANALLKTVEEPPANATILLVAHAPQRLLPTIRSRCRKLDLRPLGEREVLSVLDGLGADVIGDDPEAARLAARDAEGSVRRALTLLDPDRRQLVAELRQLLDLVPFAPTARVLQLAEKLNDRKAEGRFELALDTVQAWASERVRAWANDGSARLARLVDLCEKADDAARDLETYNLDRRPFVLGLFGDLAQAVREPA